MKKLLVGLQVEDVSPGGGDEDRPRVGIGMDASVTPIPDMPGTCLAQTTDFFYPLVDDPYLQGRIACANVLSDLYAMGVVRCHNMLMLLATSKEFTEAERDVVIPLIMRGFQDTAREAGCLVTGGQTVVNPWCTVGGVASTVCRDGDVIMPENAKPGMVLVLTKPLGTQVAVNLHQWLEEGGERWEKVTAVVSKEEVRAAYKAAMFSMARLNLTGAKLMHKYNAGAATDVTGFGILGHAKNLAENQREEVTFSLHTLPVIRNMVGVARAVGNMFQLLQGYSAETSGGLLLAISREGAENFIQDIKEMEQCDAWIIGSVDSGERTARIVESPTIIEV